MKTATAFVLSLVTNVLLLNGTASAHHRQAVVYSFFDDGGEHPVESCTSTAAFPSQPWFKPELMEFDGYRGSQLIASAQENEAGIDAWLHFFPTRAQCEDALKGYFSAD